MHLLNPFNACCIASSASGVRLAAGQNPQSCQMACSSASVGAGGASDLEQAVGRVLGSLCAITSRDEDAESAMLASWISQVWPHIVVAFMMQSRCCGQAAFEKPAHPEDLSYGQCIPGLQPGLSCKLTHCLGLCRLLDRL